MYKLLFLFLAIAMLSCQNSTKIQSDTNQEKQNAASDENSTRETDPVLDSAKLMQAIQNQKHLSTEMIVSKTWSIDSSYIQWYGEEGEDAYQANEDMNYHYSFHNDGTYNVDAVIDSKGTWKLDTEAKTITYDNEVSQLMAGTDYIYVDETTMKWITFNNMGIFVTVFHAVE